MSLPPLLPDAVRLPVNCTTAVAEELHPLFAAAALAGPVRVDAGEVESLGQAVLQLLLAAAQGPGLELTAASPAFTQRVAACGLEHRIGTDRLEEAA